MVSELALMTGIPVAAPELKLIFNQPTIKEISMIGENTFYSGMHWICLDKNSFGKDISLLGEITNFQIIIELLLEKEMAESKKDLISLFSIILPEYNCFITPQSFVLNNKQDEEISVVIDNENFDIFQNYICDILCRDSLLKSANDETEYNPGNEEAKRIAEKLKNSRKKIAELKNKKKGKSSSVLSRFLTILTVGIHSMTLEDCCNLTLYQAFELMNRMDLYTSFDLDIRARMAGADIKEEVVNWKKDLHENE